jgi:O-antigen/teichoic acid export membrane protein
MPKSKLIKNTYIYAIGEILPRLMSLFLLPIFTLYLSSEDYGIISYTNSVMLFLFVISAFALNTYLLRVYFECESEKEKKKLTGNIFLIIVIFNTIVLVVGYIIGPYIFKHANLQFPFYPFLSLSILNNFLEVFSIVPLVIFRVKENAKYFVIINVIRAILTFALTYFLIAHLDYGILGNYYGRTIVNFAFLILYLGIIFRHAELNLNFRQVKKALKFSFPLIPGALSYLLISMSDRIILERYVLLSQIGIYSVAYTLAFSLRVIITSAYRAFEPEIYKQFNSTNFYFLFREGYKIYMFSILVVASGISIFSKDILLLMTKSEFVESYLLIPILLVGGIMTAQNVMLGSIIIAEKKTYLSSLSTILGGLSSVAFNVLLIPIYGIYAASFASVIAYAVMNFIFLRGISFKPKVIKYDIIAIVLFSIFSYLIVKYSSYQKVTVTMLLIKTLVVVMMAGIYTIVYGLSLEYIKSSISNLFKRKL